MTFSESNFGTFSEITIASDFAGCCKLHAHWHFISEFGEVNVLQNLPILLTLTPTIHRSEHVRRADERRELLPEAAAAAEVRS